MILEELKQEPIKSAKGINNAIQMVSHGIESIFENKGIKLFLLVIDEFDTIFYDKRGKPSDFVYKLLLMEEALRQQNRLMTIIAISNDVAADSELESRVRSRMGSFEIFFDAYKSPDILTILKDRAAKAFKEPLDDDVLEYCASISGKEHGDARRAIDLLRIAGELASSKGEKVSKVHIDQASKQLQKDRAEAILSSLSYNSQFLCLMVAGLTYIKRKDWHPTSAIYDRYATKMPVTEKRLTYRRVFELLKELEHSGLLMSRTDSKGRKGYGTEFRLTIPPNTVAKAWFSEFIGRIQ